MRLFSDENVPMAVVNELRRFGHDVVTLQDTGEANKALPDDRVLAMSSQDERLLITLNRKDFIRIHYAGCDHRGILAWSLSASIELVTRAQSVRPDLRAWIVITRKRPRTVLGRRARATLSSCGAPVFSAELSDRMAYQEALAAGRGVTTYAPTSPAAKEIQALCDELDTLPQTKTIKRSEHAAA